MSSPVQRALHGPSWSEVIMGALLSALLGGVLGLVLLVLRPVIKAKDLPKGPVKGAVYHLEGSRESAKASAAAQKRAAFVGGQSVSVVEDELNALISAGAARAGETAKGAEPATAGGNGMLALGRPDVRMRDGVLQLAVPVTVKALDLGLKLTAQVRGTFVKQGGMFVFEPTEWFLGSLPLQRLPVLGAMARETFTTSQPIPDDIRAAWKKAAQVAIEGSVLKITMP